MDYPMRIKSGSLCSHQSTSKSMSIDSRGIFKQIKRDDITIHDSRKTQDHAYHEISLASVGLACGRVILQL